MSEKPVDLDSRRSPQDRFAAETRRAVNATAHAANGPDPAVRSDRQDAAHAEARRQAERVRALRSGSAMSASPIRPYEPERDNQDTRRRTRSESAFWGLYCPMEEETTCQ